MPFMGIIPKTGFSRLIARKGEFNLHTVPKSNKKINSGRLAVLKDNRVRLV